MTRLKEFFALEDSVMLFASQEQAQLCLEFIADAAVFGADKNELTHSADTSVHDRIKLLQITALKVTSNLSLFILRFHATLAGYAKSFWQHTGTGISSRMAEFVLRQKFESESSHLALSHVHFNDFEVESLGEEACAIIKRRLASAYSSAPTTHHHSPQLTPGVDDIFLFSSGMNAIFHAHRLLLGVRGRFKSVQFGYML